MHHQACLLCLLSYQPVVSKPSEFVFGSKLVGSWVVREEAGQRCLVGGLAHGGAALLQRHGSRASAKGRSHTYSSCTTAALNYSVWKHAHGLQTQPNFARCFLFLLLFLTANMYDANVQCAVSLLFLHQIAIHLASVFKNDQRHGMHKIDMQAASGAHRVVHSAHLPDSHLEKVCSLHTDLLQARCIQDVDDGSRHLMSSARCSRSFLHLCSSQRPAQPSTWNNSKLRSVGHLDRELPRALTALLHATLMPSGMTVCRACVFARCLVPKFVLCWSVVLRHILTLQRGCDPDPGMTRGCCQLCAEGLRQAD